MADPLPGGQLRRLNPDDLGDHLDRLYRAAWGLCGDRQEAEDLVQDTYAHVLARPRWLRGDDDLGYLLRALRNTQVSRARARARRPQTTELGERAEQRTRWDPERADDVTALFDAIAGLPRDFREALVAIDLIGLTYREAARALRVPRGDDHDARAPRPAAGRGDDDRGGRGLMPERDDDRVASERATAQIRALATPVRAPQRLRAAVAAGAPCARCAPPPPRVATRRRGGHGRARARADGAARRR